MMKWLVVFIFLLSFAVIHSAEAQVGDVQIGGVVYADMNENGVLDEFELGLGGVSVRLYDEGGVVLLESVSADIFGTFEFSVVPDRYRVRVSSYPDAGFSEVVDVSDGNDVLDVLIGVVPEVPTAVSHIEGNTGLPLDIILFGSLSLLALIAGLYIGRRRGLI